MLDQVPDPVGEDAGHLVAIEHLGREEGRRALLDGVDRGIDLGFRLAVKPADEHGRRQRMSLRPKRAPARTVSAAIFMFVS